MLSATDPDEVLRLHAQLGGELMARIAPVLAVLTEAAATDADAAALLAIQEEGRRFGMGATVERLVELGALRDDITPDRAQESLWMLSGLGAVPARHDGGAGRVDEYARLVPALRPGPAARTDGRWGDGAVGDAEELAPLDAAHAEQEAQPGDGPGDAAR